MVGMRPPKQGLKQLVMCATQALAPRHFGTRFIKVSAPVSALCHLGWTQLPAHCAAIRAGTASTCTQPRAAHGYARVLVAAS